MEVPKFNELMWPTLQALKALGGSGTNNEIVKKVIEIEKLPEEVQKKLHNNGPRPELEYRLAWARSWLKAYGALTNSARGVWTLTEFGASLAPGDMKKVVTRVAAKGAEARKQPKADIESEPKDDSDSEDWKTKLLEVLFSLKPDAFERLSQRILRESGFIDVTVVGKSGDGGIDGFGILRVSLLSFKVYFQCKRYKGTVPAEDMRGFRGAMQGRAGQGLFLTTGVFSKPARDEAQRDGAPLIDLVDGDQLCDLLKDLKIGISVQESITADTDWLSKI